MANLVNLLKINRKTLSSSNRIDAHYSNVINKKMLLEIFNEFHLLFINYSNSFFAVEGSSIEVGAGSYPMNLSYKEIMSSDIVYGKNLNLVFDAHNMPFRNSSIRSIFFQNTFHHIENPNKFFLEANRVLKRGGGIIIIDPYYNFVSKVIYKLITRDELFDKGIVDWNQKMDGPMKGANQALSYIVFKRDKRKFEKKYPNLDIIYEKPLNNYLRYILSGGVNFIQLFPDCLIKLLKLVEIVLSPFARFLAIHHIVVIRKK
jgi:SAM-dependent methyltransferase